MIGRKISDQTITCKVIKPIAIINTNSNIKTKESQSPSKQEGKFVNMNFGQIEHTQRKVFGINNKQLEVSLDIGLEYENEFNRLNYFDKERNVQRSQKEIGRNQFINGGSRNVTHFFINHKEKPINIEPVKKTTQINKNNISMTGSNEIKKYSEISNTQDVSVKVIKEEKSVEIEKKPANIISSNKSGLIDKKIIGHKTGIVEKNSARISILASQEKSKSKYQVKTDNQKMTNQSVTQSNKQTPKINKHLHTQQSQQRMSISQNSSNLIKSNSRDHLTIKKQINLNMKKREETSSKKPTEKSAKKLENSMNKDRSSVSVKKNEKGKSRVSEKEIKQMQQISFQPWEKISEEPSVCIENYGPNQSYHLEKQKDIKVNKKVDEMTKQKIQTKGINQPQSIKRPSSQKPTNLSKPAQKRYLSVKEEIEEKLKEKKLKQMELEMRKKQIQEQRRHQEKQLEVDDGCEDDDCGDQEQEEEEERTDIPQPILGTDKQTIDESKTVKENSHLQMKQQRQIKNTQEVQLNESEGLKNSQLIYHQLITNQSQVLFNQIPSNHLKYNYIESSDEESNTEKQKQTYGEGLEDESEVIKFGNNYQNHREITDKLTEFKKFDGDLQEDLSFRLNHHPHIHIQQQNAQFYEDQQIFDDIKKGKLKNLSRNKEIQLIQQNLNQKIDKRVGMLNPAETIKKPQILPKIVPQQQPKSQESSDEQQEEENNPKLLQYLKQRNLISSSNKRKVEKNMKNMSHHPHFRTNQSSSKVSISEILNNSHLSQTNSRQIIIEVDEEYLQSSIIVGNSNEVNNNGVDSFYGKDDSRQVELIRTNIIDLHSQKFNSINICDSSDSQQTDNSNLVIPTPFVNTKSSPFDELFDLNLDSLLKKQFIQLQ